jgi:hypothetical protein
MNVLVIDLVDTMIVPQSLYLFSCIVAVHSSIITRINIVARFSRATHMATCMEDAIIL